ncbi:hypothetical protein D5274_09600 [bacterium 1XD42-94]|nr:hypothetical protein [bacterium 1XD42-76]NBK05390.1 hypothetical protein [bacterium 1XD42-94]
MLLWPGRSRCVSRTAASQKTYQKKKYNGNCVVYFHVVVHPICLLSYKTAGQSVYLYNVILS